MASDVRLLEITMTDGPSRSVNAAVEKIVRGIEDPDLDARYPNGTHFVPADHPRHGEMVTRTLFSGKPVVLVYPDGREFLFTPDRTAGIVGLLALLFLAVAALNRRRSEADVVRMPPRTRIEARDAGGLPIAA
jgi:hypothetical protein